MAAKAPSVHAFPLAAKSYNDLGGLIVYFNNDKLVAFYDYERLVGTVFE
jgi:hypothetical protein